MSGFLHIGLGVYRAGLDSRYYCWVLREIQIVVYPIRIADGSLRDGMDRRRMLALSGVFVAGALAGCSLAAPDDENDDGTPTPTPSEVDDSVRELVRHSNGFAFDLYEELLRGNSENNLFSSPLSITMALGMAYAGARGETRAQMREVLRYPLDDAALHGAFGSVRETLNARATGVEEANGRYGAEDDPVPFTLSIVNAMWGQEAYPFLESYDTILKEAYDSELREVNYIEDAAGARDAINEWVAGETDDRIDELLPAGALNSLTRLVLVNAVYFLANWKYPFDDEITSTESFQAVDGREYEVPMMRQEHSWLYGEVDGVQVVELPYIGEEVSMVVLLPPEGSFGSFEDSLTSESIGSYVTGVEEREGEVRLPRFGFSAGFTLGDVLRSMGMVDAFDEQAADFSGIADPSETGESLLIDDVYHDAFVAVDEEGTEAAAATGVVIRTESAPSDPFSLVADRPFVFVIRDRPTNAVLFVGRVVDPGGWE